MDDASKKELLTWLSDQKTHISRAPAMWGDMSAVEATWRTLSDVERVIIGGDRDAERHTYAVVAGRQNCGNLAIWSVLQKRHGETPEAYRKLIDCMKEVDSLRGTVKS